jgi:hypothetical protein
MLLRLFFKNSPTRSNQSITKLFVACAHIRDQPSGLPSTTHIVPSLKFRSNGPASLSSAGFAVSVSLLPGQFVNNLLIRPKDGGRY